MSRHIREVLSSAPTRQLAAFAALISLACQSDEPFANCCAPIRVALSAPALSLAVGEDRLIMAWTVDAAGRTVRASPDWSSADPTIATVGQTDGLVIAIAAGTTTVTAAVGTLSASMTVTVRPAALPIGISISPTALGLLVGHGERLSASLVDSTGTPTPALFEWSSADPTIATVGQADGLVTGISDGTTTVTVASGAFRASGQVTVIALSSPIAFTRITWAGGGERYASDVLVPSSDGTEESLPRPAQFKWVAAPAWSPDDSQLAIEVIYTFYDTEGFWYTSDLYVVDASAPGTTPWRALTSNGLSSAPSWSPDGKRIAYLQESRIHVVDAAGGTSVQLTKSAGWYGQPRWSPDGTRLVFSAWVGQPNVSQIYTVNADGSGFTALRVDQNSFDPNWSPNGSQIVFVHFRRVTSVEYYYDILVSDTDGRNLRRVATPASAPNAPTWSHDGRQILFSVDGTLYVANADGSGMVRVTTPPERAADRWPSWRR